MTPQQAVSNKYDARIRRAEKLIAGKSSASELLSFYVRIAGFQKGLLRQVGNASQGRSAASNYGAIRQTLDLALLLPQFGGFLSLVRQLGPGALAKAASDITELASEGWIELLRAYWDTGGRSPQKGEAFAQFFPRAFLQPYAEYLAERTAAPPTTAIVSTCPLCEGRPLLGLLRAEGDGGKRHLVCSFCSHEWEFRRILCPACGEEEERRLPVYVAEQFPHLRVEACDSCKFFIRTIDLTKDGRAVPMVDDLAAIPLTLWAGEHGYRRLEPNLLGS